MAIPVVGDYTSNTATDSASLTLTKPAGVQVGDFLLILVGNDNDTSTNQWDDVTYKPEGFTLIAEAGDTASDSHIAAFYRIADGSEGETIDVPAESAMDYWGFYTRVSGVRPTNPIDGFKASPTVAATYIDLLGVGTDVDDCLAFYLQAFDGADGGGFIASDTGWSKTAEIEANPGSPVGASGSWGTKEMPTAGATGTVRIANVAVLKDGWCGFQFTIAPPAYYHGFSVQGVGELALCSVGNNPLRIRKGGTTYGLELVKITEDKASAVRIKVPVGIRAIRKFA